MIVVDEINSGWTIDGVQQTWKMLAERHEREINRLSRLVSLLQDLDRCEHGRHSTDSCCMCEGGVARGHHLRGTHLGYTMSGDFIIYPPKGTNTNDPKVWVSPR